jgi:hypothetical protein
VTQENLHGQIQTFLEDARKRFKGRWVLSRSTRGWVAISPHEGDIAVRMREGKLSIHYDSCGQSMHVDPRLVGDEAWTRRVEEIAPTLEALVAHQDLAARQGPTNTSGLQFIREVVFFEGDPRREKHAIGVVRSNTYNSSFEHLQKLRDLAWADFPLLQDEDLIVRQYGGDRIKRIFGLEFRVPQETIPVSYHELREPWPIL